MPFYITNIWHKKKSVQITQFKCQMEMFSGDDSAQHICKTLISDGILLFPRTQHVDHFIPEKLQTDQNVWTKKMNLIFNTQKQMHFLHNLLCPALHQVDIKDLDKQSLFQYNYHVSQLWGFTRPRHFRLINKPLTNLNSSAMTHPALALQYIGKWQKLKHHTT